MIAQRINGAFWCVCLVLTTVGPASAGDVRAKLAPVSSGTHAPAVLHERMAPCDGGDVFYNQNAGYDGVDGLVSQRNGVYDAWTADKITLLGAATITGVHWWTVEIGSAWNGTADLQIWGVDPDTGGPDDDNVIASLVGVPNLRTDTGQIWYGYPVFLYDFTDLNIALGSGTYYLGVRPVGTSGVTYWLTSGPGELGNEAWFIGPNFGVPYWIPGSNEDAYGTPEHQAFCLSGTYIAAQGACCYDTGYCTQVAALLCGNLLGDANCDGVIDFGDIDPFVAMLSGGTIPDCPRGNSDCNHDGVLTFDDINQFIDILSHQPETRIHGTYLGLGTPCSACPCIVPCPPGATPENEPCYIDTNGGCNSTPPIFGSISCGETICGTSYFDGNYRDTDWYRLTGLIGPISFTVTAAAEFDLQLLFITDNGNDCLGYTYLIATAPACATAMIATPTLPVSTYYIWVGPQYTSTFACTESDPQYWVHLAWGIPCGSGACCKPEVCYDGYTESDCLAMGGYYYGDNTLCANVICPPPPPGETCETAIPIDAVPYTDSGNTCLYVHDYTATCGSSTARDVVYRWTPTEDGLATASLCAGASFDTVLHVMAPCGADIVCNDDYCGLQSQVSWSVTAGTEYFIVVTGYNVDCGDYVLSVSQEPPFDCPPGATDEGEPCNIDTNGGCNSSPFMWGYISCGETVCGTSYFDGAYRDTDWFIVTGLTGANVFTLTAAAKFDLQLLFITDRGNDCDGYTVLSATAPAYATAMIVTADLPLDTYYVSVGPRLTSTFACVDGDPQYWVRLDCTAVPSGACCKCGLCYDGYTIDACAAINGTYQGDGTLCADIVCPPAPLGENCVSPVIVTSLPFTGSDVPCFGPDTCWYSSDYAPRTCGYDAGAPDFVLRYTPDDPNITAINISLCGSAYDTLLWVYAGDCAGTEIACNDDFCGLQSEIDHLAVTTGTPYYIVVGGFANSCGYFEISITEDVPCVLTCPPGASDEGEPCDTDTNGGCDGVPPVFGSISCGETVCGTSWCDGATRDTDWYRIEGLTGANDLTVTAEAEFDLQLLLITDTSNNCVDYTYLIATAAPCQIGTITAAAAPLDTYYVWVGPQFTTDFACTEGNPQYWVHLDCVPVPTGACCKNDGCSDGYTAAACAAIYGMYMGDNTFCANVICPMDTIGETCDTANVISALPYDDSKYTCYYLDDYDEVCPYAGSTAPDVVYRYTPSANVLVDISLCNDGTDYDTKLYVYEGGCPGPLIACNDDYCSTPQYPYPYVSWLPGVALSAGVTYYLIVDGYGGACGNYHLSVTMAPAPVGACCQCWNCYDGYTEAACLAFEGQFQGADTLCADIPSCPPPPPGQICDLWVIPAVPYQDTGNTCVYALDCPANCGANNAPDVTYQWTPTEDGVATASLCGSSFDTVIHVQTSYFCDNDIVCNDDYEPCGLQSQVSWDASAAVPYYIIVSGYATSCGNYVLNVSEEVPRVPEPPPGPTSAAQPRDSEWWLISGSARHTHPTGNDVVILWRGDFGWWN